MMMTSLTVGIKKMRDDALQITKDDLENPFDKGTVTKLRLNPLKRSFQGLSDVLRQCSREEQERESKRAKEARAIKKAKAAKEEEAKTTAIAKDPTSAKVPSTSQSTIHANQPLMSGSHGPSTPPIPVTPQKRKVSDTSFGKISAEGTPSKLKSPETNIQNVQNQLVYDVLEALYDVPAVPVSWAENRESMRITYETFVRSSIRN